jgi:rhamnulokinase
MPGAPGGPSPVPVSGHRRLRLEQTQAKAGQDDMATDKHFLAFDLGASSGRAMLGTFAGGRLRVEEIHRFENGGIDVNGGLFWNLLGLFAEMKHGLKKALARGIRLSGMAIDTWGVDFALLDAKGQFVGFPRCYRDPRNATIYDYVFRQMPRDTLYSRTGIQFMPFNSLFQLCAMQRDSDPALAAADKLLFMPNALVYLFSGVVSAEYTIASTSQALDPATRQWAWDVIRQLRLPERLFPDIVPPCSVAGPLRPAICEELNCEPLPVLLTGGHDTASAVAAVPAATPRGWAYLSSGTWSLLGMELDAPRVTSRARQLNYTNEGGVGGKIRFLKNIMGLWLLQESRTHWQRQGTAYSWEDMGALAEGAAPFRSLIDPNDDSFLTPGDMPSRIQAFCRRTGQPVPDSPGAIIRCALESLALRYRQTVEELEELTGESIQTLHLVGGGTRNRLLNQFTADAVQRCVVTGPVEATAIGNLIGQALAVGDLPDLAAARALVRDSFSTETFTPLQAAAWDEAYRRYRSLVP